MRNRLASVACLIASCVPLLAAAEGKEKTKVGPVFEDGEAQIVAEFTDSDYWIRHDLWVETESDTDGDGKLDRVHVAVTRPVQTETEGLRLPVVYGSSPYYAGVSESGEEHHWTARQELNVEPPDRPEFLAVKRTGMRPIISKRHLKEWVPRGYIVVHSSSPGTGLSRGCPTIGGENESLAPKAVIEWLCGRDNGYTTVDGNDRVTAPWCNGNVGMTGTSYNGTIPLAAATTGVEGLKAIIPVAPNTSYYHYYRSNGLVRHPGGYIGEDIDVLYDFVHSGPEDTREYCDCEIRDKEMRNGFDRKNGDYNDFWAGRDYLNQLDRVKAAVLMSHAFNDWNVMPEHSFRISEALKARGVPVQTFYHQGGHGGPPPMKMMNRWFTRYLHGIKNDVEKDPKSWIVREDDDQDSPTAYPDYPHPDAEPVALHLIGGAPARGRLSVTAEPNQIPETLEDNYSFDGETLARAAWTDHRLIYVSETLNEPLHLSGTAKISVRMACDRSAANLSVWLVSLPWNPNQKAKITDNIITRGWADPQNHESMREGQPLQQGKFYDVSFDLQPDDQIIPAGQQIGLMIFSSDQEFTLHPDPGTRITVDPANTSLELPIVGGVQAWQKSLEPKPAAETAATDP